MRCENCGGIIGNKFAKINGVVLCDRCAKSMGIDIPTGFGGFSNLSALTNAIMASGSDLDFTTTKVSCPRCGTQYKEFEMNNRVGCIECYNFFNNLIIKTNLRLQGSSEYMGRKPGEKADIMPDIELNNLEEAEVENTTGDSPFVQPLRMKKDSEVKENNNKESDKKSETKKSIYERLLKADLGMVDDDDLHEAMLQAAAAEDYVFAAKLRDELKSRKEDKKDVE